MHMRKHKTLIYTGFSTYSTTLVRGSDDWLRPSYGAFIEPARRTG